MVQTCSRKIIKFYSYQINYLYIKLDMNMHIYLGFKITSTAHKLFTTESIHSN